VSFAVELCDIWTWHIAGGRKHRRRGSGDTLHTKVAHRPETWLLLKKIWSPLRHWQLQAKVRVRTNARAKCVLPPRSAVGLHYCSGVLGQKSYDSSRALCECLCVLRMLKEKHRTGQHLYQRHLIPVCGMCIQCSCYLLCNVICITDYALHITACDHSLQLLCSDSTLLSSTCSPDM
jgi:hypothetical protein